MPIKLPSLSTRKKQFVDFYEALGKTQNEALFERLVNADSLKPSVTPAKVVALVVVLLVHSLTLIFVVFGLISALATLSAFCLFPFALFFLALAWMLRPRLQKVPDELLSRADFPTLYALADQVTLALGTSPVDAISVEGNFNASFSVCGWRRKRILTLGLTLWSVLDPEERLALISHELAHAVNGDFSRIVLISSAAQTLVEWYRLLQLDYLFQGALGCIALPLILVGAVIAQVVYLVAYLLAHLLWHESRRAEYLADYLAASVAGTSAQLHLLRKLLFLPRVDHVIRQTALSNSSSQQDMFALMRTQVMNSPLLSFDELERLQDAPRLNMTHPPITYRVRFLRLKPALHPTLYLSPQDSLKIDAELTPLQSKVQRRLLDAYLSHIAY
jgi:Zn-dependent protease with chaperone function